MYRGKKVIGISLLSMGFGMLVVIILPSYWGFFSALLLCIAGWFLINSNC